MKKWAAEFIRGEIALRMVGGLAATKRHSLMNISRSYTPRRREIRSMASEVGISFWAAHSILTDILGMLKVSASWVPQMLPADQKRNQINFSRCLLSRYEDNHGDFIERVVTHDETCVHYSGCDFDPESKMQSK